METFWCQARTKAAEIVSQLSYKELNGLLRGDGTRYA